MYKWDKSYIQFLKDKYSAMAELTTSKDKKVRYEEVLGSLSMLPTHSLSILHVEKTNYGEDVDKEINLLHSYGSYTPIIRDLQKYYDKTNIPIVNLSKVNISKDQLIDYCDQFYYQFNDKLVYTYSRVSSRFDKTLQFYNLKRNESNGGETYSIANTNLSFLEIGLNNTIQDFIALAHEVEHAINSFNNINIMYDIDKYCFIEADALFIEMISADFISDKLDKQLDGFYYQLVTLKDYLYSNEIICAKMDMYNELSGNHLYNKNDNITYLRNNTEYNNIFIKDIVSTKINTIFHYIISYLTAVELYLIYLEDNNKALDLYTKIRDIRGLSNTGYLNYVRSLGINPGTNFDKYIILLKKKGKSVHDKKLQHK